MVNIKLLTWNIWFDENYRQKRTESILEESFIYQPDFIAFQEVVPETSRIILNKKGEYNVIGYPLTQNYDTLILSKYQCVGWNRYVLPNSEMGRNLLIGDFNILDENISIGTFHLESVFNKRNNIKINQLQYIAEITPEKCILMGDTNFTEDTQDVLHMNHHQEKRIIDIYEKIGEPLAYKNTYSGILNTNVRNKRYNSRLDRIYLKNAYNNSKINSFFLTGIEPNIAILDPKSINTALNNFIHPSDHFGVFTSISL